MAHWKKRLAQALQRKSPGTVMWILAGLEEPQRNPGNGKKAPLFPLSSLFLSQISLLKGIFCLFLFSF